MVSEGPGLPGDNDLDVRVDRGDGRQEPPGSRPGSTEEDAWELGDVADIEELVVDATEGAELLPAVPLLPSIAGRVDALSGLLRSITGRIDSLGAAHDVYRAAVTDRIDQYTDTILQESRRTEQLLEQYQRSTEASASEARRRAAEQEAAVAALAERQTAVERAVRDVRTLVEAVVDTMPASEEGSAVDLIERIDALQDDLLGLHRRVTAKGSRALATVADLDWSAKAAEAVHGSLDVDAIADAVVARLDVDAIVSAVVARLEDAFEIVGDLPAAEPAPRPSRARDRRPR